MKTSFDFGVPLLPSEASPDVTFEHEIGETPKDWTGQLVYHDAPSIRGSGILLRIGETGETLSFRGVSDFRFGPREIECVSRSSKFDYLVTIQFLGYVMSYWLERNGVFALHGSGIFADDGAIGFLAGKGTGKSTVAATLIQMGYDFITDDILAIRTEEGLPTVSPAYPHIRMEPELISHFPDLNLETFPLVHPAFEKRRVPIEALGGRMADGPVPLRAFAVLERARDDREGVEVQRLSSSEAIVDILRHSFLAEIMQRLAWRTDRLRGLSELISAVPLAKVTIPTSKSRLKDGLKEALTCLSAI